MRRAYSHVYHEYYYSFSRGCGFAGVSVGFGTGCDGVSAGFGAGCTGVPGGTEPSGVGVMGREGVSHDLFILCPPTFLFDCWVDFFSLAILCHLPWSIDFFNNIRNGTDHNTDGKKQF